MLDRLFLMQELVCRIRLAPEAAAKTRALHDKAILHVLAETPLDELRRQGKGLRAALRTFIETDAALADMKKLLRTWDPHRPIVKEVTEAGARRLLVDLVERRIEPCEKVVKPVRAAARARAA